MPASFCASCIKSVLLVDVRSDSCHAVQRALDSADGISKLYCQCECDCNRKLYSLVLSCTHCGKTIVGKNQLFAVLRIGYDSILVFNLFSIYLCWIYLYRKIQSR